MSPDDFGYVCDSCAGTGTGYPPRHAASCPLACAPRHGARGPFEALPHGFATEPEPAVSVFDAPEAGRAAAVADGRELAAAFEAACNHPAGWDDVSMARWCGRAAAVLGELTRDA